ncbi:hypothetical protein D9M68_926290 [compost metagenome]
MHHVERTAADQRGAEITTIFADTFEGLHHHRVERQALGQRRNGAGSNGLGERRRFLERGLREGRDGRQQQGSASGSQK